MKSLFLLWFHWVVEAMVHFKAAQYVWQFNIFFSIILIIFESIKVKKWDIVSTDDQSNHYNRLSNPLIHNQKVQKTAGKKKCLFLQLKHMNQLPYINGMLLMLMNENKWQEALPFLAFFFLGLEKDQVLVFEYFKCIGTTFNSISLFLYIVFLHYYTSTYIFAWICVWILSRWQTAQH